MLARERRRISMVLRSRSMAAFLVKYSTAMGAEEWRLRLEVTEASSDMRLTLGLAEDGVLNLTCLGCVDAAVDTVGAAAAAVEVVAAETPSTLSSSMLVMPLVMAGAGAAAAAVGNAATSLSASVSSSSEDDHPDSFASSSLLTDSSATGFSCLATATGTSCTGTAFTTCSSLGTKAFTATTSGITSFTKSTFFFFSWGTTNAFSLGALRNARKLE
mmetsp:Transcript_37975/g.69735  ORF Transcript_37975/g.69735 Transcript_37975/m.69735 type:complete len:216 (-) Transcript_37975:301-948(-)